MTPDIPIPRYYQIFDYLQRHLQDHQYAPGEKLPTEKELELTFGVSRVTARRALEEMERKGFVTRHRGKGTYVAAGFQVPEFPKFTGSLDHLFMIGRAGVVKEATVEQIIAPPRVKVALQLDDPEATVTRIRRVLLLHGRSFGYHQNFYPQSIGERIRREDALKHPLLEILEKKLHIPVIEVDQVIEAAVADIEISERLEMPFGSPLLYVERTLLAEKRMPIGFVQAYYRGDGYRLSVTLLRENEERSEVWRPPTLAELRKDGSQKKQRQEGG